MAGAGVIELTENNFEAEVLNATGPVLVDFWAEWCQPCRMLGPTIDQLASEYAGKAKIAKVNVEEAQGLAVRYAVQAIPTILLFKDGQVRETFRGLRPKKDFAAALDKLTA